MIGRSVPTKMPVNNLALAGLAQAPNMLPQRKGPGAGRGIAGSIGDFLLQYAGASPIFGPEMQRRHDMDMRRELLEEQRAFDWRDFVRRSEYERANPKPANNDTVADYQFIRDKLGDGPAQDYLRNKTLPPMMGVDIQNADGSVTRQFYPRGGALGAPRQQSFDTLPEGFVVDEGGASPGGSRPFP